MKTIGTALLRECMVPTSAGSAKRGDEKRADRVSNRTDAQANVFKNHAGALNAEATQVREIGKRRGDAIDAAKLDTQAMSKERKGAIVKGAAPAVR